VVGRSVAVVRELVALSREAVTSRNGSGQAGEKVEQRGLGRRLREEGFRGFRGCTLLLRDLSCMPVPFGLFFRLYNFVFLVLYIS
jgi:hypothetical protein